jgi:hypothetical protein
MTRPWFPRAFCLAVLSLTAAGSAFAQGDDASGREQPRRWSGSGSLQRAHAQTTPDRRFALEARLQKPSSPVQTDSTQRFALSARLVAPKALAGSCAASGDSVFRNGFE